MARNTAEVLEQGAQTFKDRQPIYGNNLPKIGGALAAMFPDGLTLKTEQDFGRFYCFLMTVVKQTRYANNFSTGGHPDSSYDACVYSAMLAAADEDYQHAASQRATP